MIVENSTKSELEKIEIELLLDGIYRYYGFDFRDYAFSSIRRRIVNRKQVEGLNSISELQAKVLHQQEYLDRLLNDLSINVTEMFRDPTFFKSFRENVVPHLRKLPFIRIWHAGCSSGEEAYSMAILLKEEGLYDKAKIYATDMNEDILERAAEGKISFQQMQLYTKNYHQAGGMQEFSEYYTAYQDYVKLHPSLRKNMVFAHHNLATDYSFNEFHVVICRNVMIYFNKHLTDRVYDLIYRSLSEGGFLGLGSKEAMTGNEQANLYREIDSAEKIYQKASTLD
ncbi:protein-glutamate O-methyltransferase CheR [Alkalihalobacillus sp. LMS39]|uniref:CheR family methyltransferase n=1 Tax=Alkalihalobacillus sp. LMS39 TaxID=2924032 RepID=UPI001FB43DB9|nr:protein-glutamate O-methyltransferase CheR [Alkalihalobacillus sp. LMS39]UOE96410.1 protein-glutamate O-methyltransferase CheR [Alkalihalobacillus sp. LMS39]